MWGKAGSIIYTYFFKIIKNKIWYIPDNWITEILNKTKRKYETVMGSQTYFSTTDYIICSHTQHFIDKEEEIQIITGDI